MPGFDLIERRLARAREHIQTLEAAVELYTVSRPFEYDRMLSPDGTRWIETVRLRVLPPVQLAIVLSDVIHQLRSALDNSIGVIREGGASESSAFPIAVSQDRFEDLAVRRRQLEGVPPGAIDFVHSLQPFAEGAGAEVAGTALRMLHELARYDRHQAPLLHAAFMKPMYVEVSSDEVDVRYGGDWESWATVSYPSGERAIPHWAVTVVATQPSGEPIWHGTVERLAEHLYEQVESVIAGMRRVVDDTM